MQNVTLLKILCSNELKPVFVKFKGVSNLSNKNDNSSLLSRYTT